MSQVQAETPQAFAAELGEVFVAYRSQLRRAAHRILGDVHGAEDTVHDAYLKAMEMARARTDDVVGQPLSYAHRVVRNLAIDRYRRGALEAQIFEIEDSGSHVAAPDAGTPEAMLSERQALTRVAQALATLPKRARLAFELYRRDGLTQREIAEELGVSAATVNGLLRCALQQCRDALRGSSPCRLNPASSHRSG